ncbi:autophagy protein Apg5 [Teladorsagia circumcincta]|uniref:Autophagy protein 5 n=1 Tax=Teladorsagia circumcincta TaxID=45464 RepID=A0A2G9TZT7_TELCI|nr:autophagy protein Apg5 [Teladorsagia circumcincta]
MAGEFDYEVSRKIWEAAVPVEFQVERDDDSGDACRPCYAMLPRCSYFSLHLTRILEQVRAREESVKLDADKVWLECNGLPLKTYYPVGVLFDLYKPPDTPTITVLIKTAPRPEGVSLVSKDTMESIFMQSLKEANYLKRRKDQVVSTMKIDEHKQLWSGIVHDRFDEFWSINRRLMECSEERPFHDIPIRLYITGQPFRQVPQPPHDENGEPRTLSHALTSLSSDLVENGKYRFISHGITLPLETPLTYLGKNFAYPDNFVHICAVSDSSA